MNATICRALVATAIAVSAAPAATPAIAETTGTTDVTVVAIEGGGDGNLPEIVPVSPRPARADRSAGLVPTGDAALAAAGLFAAASAAAGVAGMLARSREKEEDS